MTVLLRAVNFHTQHLVNAMKLVLNGVSLLTDLSTDGKNMDHAKFIEGSLVVLEDGTLCFGRGYVEATDTSMCRFSFRVHMSGLTVQRQNVLGLLVHRLECGSDGTIIIRILDKDQQLLFEDICWAWKTELLTGTIKEIDLVRVAEEIASERKGKNLELENIKVDLKASEGNLDKCRLELETCRRDRLRLIEKTIQQADDLKKAWGLFPTLGAGPEKSEPIFSRLSDADAMIDAINRTKKQFLVWDEDPGIGVILACYEPLASGMEPMGDVSNYALLKRDFKWWHKILVTLAAVRDDCGFNPCVTCVARSWKKSDCNYPFGTKRSCTGCAASGLICWKVIRIDIGKGFILEKRPGMRVEEKTISQSRLRRLQNFLKAKLIQLTGACRYP